MAPPAPALAMWPKFLNVLRTEPNVVLYAVGALVTAWVAFGFRASPGQVGAVSVIAAGLITIITALAARPVAVPVVTGAVVTVATAAGAFGLHLSAAQLGSAVPVLSVVLALVLRQAVTPVVTIRRQAAVSAAPQEGKP